MLHSLQVRSPVVPAGYGKKTTSYVFEDFENLGHTNSYYIQSGLDRDTLFMF